jgi:acetyltransferase
MKQKTTYEYLMKPDHIAVIGASNDELKPGGRVLKKIKDNGYIGDLWAINPKTPDIMGLPTVTDMASLPNSPDLVIIALPSKLVIPSLEAIADKGAGAVIVLSAGFGETGAEGKAAEQKMLEIAGRGGFVLIGPNCSGFHTKRYKGKFTGPVPDLTGERIDVISGSGATVDFIMDNATMRGLSFGDVVNLGNSIMVGVEDFLALYDENYGPDNAKVLMLYMESIRKPQTLLKHARSLVQKGCYIVGVKSGATEAGSKAAASHTGAMASSDTAVQALFDKAGIIRVKSKMELIDVTCGLAACRGPIKGNRVCVLTDAGGPGVMLSDELCRQGMVLPALKETTRQRLAEILPKEAATGNPIDCLPSRTAESIEATIRILGEEEKDDIDAIVFIVGDSGISDIDPIYQAAYRAMDSNPPIPVVPVWVSLSGSAKQIDRFRKTEKVFFPEEVRAAEALGKITRQPRLSDPTATLPGYDKAAMAAILDGKKGVLDPETAENLLNAAGFTLPAQAEVFDKTALSEACDKIGYPLVMKVIGPLHKSDVGGVKFGIKSLPAAETAFDELMAIKDAKGALLQPMVSGTEMILGASREGDYGHLIMFGLGGIYAEVFKDVRFALAPLSAEESMGLIRGIRSLPILEGVRGQKGVDLEVVSDNLQRLGMLVSDFPQIKEVDLNPLKGIEKNLYAIDARIILDD